MFFAALLKVNDYEFEQLELRSKKGFLVDSNRFNILHICIYIEEPQFLLLLIVDSPSFKFNIEANLFISISKHLVPKNTVISKFKSYTYLIYGH